MSETESTVRDSLRSPAMALAQWLVLVALVFAAVGWGMTWVSQAVEISSPVAPAIAQTPMDGAAPGVGVGGASAGGAYLAPSFRLPTLDGGPLGPPDFPGKVVLVEFWATWCGPCRLQAKILDKLHDELGGQGVQFLAVDVGEDEARVRDYVARSPFPYPVLLDTQDSLMARFRIFGLPTVMIVDRQGQISYMETGVSPADKLRRELVAAGAAI